MIDDENKERAVEVTLPDEPITEVTLGDSSEIKEEAPKVSVKEAKEPEVDSAPVVDERERALQDLKKQYEAQKLRAEAEREARRQAEMYARQQAQHLGRANIEVQDGNLRVILNAIDATEQAADNAQRDYADAMAAGDYALAAKAQRAIAQCEAHLLQLNNGKQKLEEYLHQTTEGSVYEPQVPSFEPNIPQDPVEMYAAKLTPKSAQWLREHPEVVGKIGKLTRAHQDAVEDGIVAESPEYFQYIESRLGYSGAPSSRSGDPEPQQDLPQRAPSQPAPSRKNLASAPVSSSTTSISPRPSSSNTMVLSPSEVEAAILMEPSLPREKAIEVYARSKADLIRQGKMSA